MAIDEENPYNTSRNRISSGRTGPGKTREMTNAIAVKRCTFLCHQVPDLIPLVFNPAEIKPIEISINFSMGIFFE